jgi:hypothetical protein
VDVHIRRLRDALERATTISSRPWRRGLPVPSSAEARHEQEWGWPLLAVLLFAALLYHRKLRTCRTG